MQAKTPNQIRNEFWAKRQNLLDKALADPEIVRKAMLAVDRSVAMANMGLGAEIGIERALVDEFLKTVAEKFIAGRKPGTAGPIRKAIRRLLEKSPDLKNAGLWAELSVKPPKGWTFFDNHLGKYAEGPKGGQNMNYSTFRNVAALERKAFKG